MKTKIINFIFHFTKQFRRQKIPFGLMIFFTILWINFVMRAPILHSQNVQPSQGKIPTTSKPSKLRRPIKEFKKITKPVENAVTKTAETAVKEIQYVAKEAHSLGGKFLQGLINIMIAASPGKTRVYLPAPSSDPNSGMTIGVLPVFLFVDEKEVIRHILAPSVTYNRLFKINSTMRYYWYPHPGAQLFTIASYAVETNRRFTLRYEDPRFFSDWFYFKFDFTTVRDGSLRFFGFGPDSKSEKQSNYTLKDNHLQLFTGINFLEKFRLTLSHRFRLVDAIDGPIGSLPKISSFNPQPAGVNNLKSIMAQRLSFFYDSRNLAMAPISGYTFLFFGEHGGRIGGEVKFERLGAELKGFHPLKKARFVTGWRFAIEGENGGDELPFYERSLLGGKDSLRGFGESRFVDHNKLTFSLEERIRLYTLNAFNVNIDFEVTPFYEAATVYHKPDSFRPIDLHHVGGIGFRTVVRPNVVGIIDLGFGEEGTTIFVGIDYPF